MPRSTRLMPYLLPPLVLACEGKPSPPAPVPSAARAPTATAYVPPPSPGCARTGKLEAVELDPTCLVAHADDMAWRDVARYVAFDLTPDAPVVTGGGTLVVRLTITNRAPTETALVFDAQAPGTIPRPDWSRLAGVPEPRPTGSAGQPETRASDREVPSPRPPVEPAYRLALPIRTLDEKERPVDGLPTMQPPTHGAGIAPTLLRVRLPPGGKLTHAFAWWAFRIPTPGPITRDDAGHRFVPKTAPVPLSPGEYIVSVDLPLHGSTPPESTVTARVRVERPRAD